MADETDKPSNVVPFFRFPKPDDSGLVTISNETLRNMVQTSFAWHNNPVLLKLHDIIYHEIDTDWRGNGVVVFSSSSHTDYALSVFMPDPIPEHCYQLDIYLSWGKKIGLSFYGRDDRPVLDIAQSSRPLTLDFPKDCVDSQVESCVEALFDAIRKHEPVTLEVGQEASEIARLRLNRYTNTYIGISVAPHDHGRNI